MDDFFSQAQVAFERAYRKNPENVRYLSESLAINLFLMFVEEGLSMTEEESDAFCLWHRRLVGLKGPDLRSFGYPI